MKLDTNAERPKTTGQNYFQAIWQINNKTDESYTITWLFLENPKIVEKDIYFQKPHVLDFARQFQCLSSHNLITHCSHKDPSTDFCLESVP